MKYDAEQEYHLYCREKVYAGADRGTFPIHSLSIGQVSGAALSGSSAFFLCAYGVGRRSAGGVGPRIG